MPPVLYTADFPTPDLLQRGRDEGLICRVRRAGAVAAPTEAGSTISVYDQSGTAIVDAAAVTVDSDGFATYTLLGSVTTSLSLSKDWRIAWSLIMPDGVTHLFENRAVLCRRVPAPVVGEGALYSRVPALNPNGHSPITRETEFSSFIDEAWVVIVNRLVESGRRIELVLDPSALREVHLTLTLSLIFEDLAVRANASYSEAAAMYREQYETAWARLSPDTDTDDDGDKDANLPARGPVWAC